MTHLPLAWNDPAAVRAYKREKVRRWRLANPERYRAQRLREMYRRKLRECGLTDVSAPHTGETR